MYLRTALIVAMFLMPLVFADVGPGPDPVSVVVKVVDNGAPYTGTVEMTYLCSAATARTTEPKNSVDPYDMKMTCEAGECVRGTYYKFNDCFYSNGRFELKADGKTLTSEEVSLETPGSYEFDMNVETGALTAAPDKPQGLKDYFCIIPGVLMALLVGGAYVRSRK